MATEKIATTDQPDRLKIYVQIATKRIKDFGLPGLAVREPELEKAMKGGKPVVFGIRFENDKFIAEASCAGTVLTMAALDLAKQADRVKRRSLLKAIVDHSNLATQADLDAFDKKFPPPPDPVKLKALKEEIERLKFEIERDKGFIKNWPKSFKTMNPGLAEIGFTNWAKGHRYDRYVTFLLWTDWGRDGQSIYDEFLKPGAARLVKITDAASKQAQTSIQAKTPKFDLAVKEVTKVVDTILIPLFRKEDGGAVEKRITEAQKELARKAGELKALLGR